MYKNPRFKIRFKFSELCNITGVEITEPYMSYADDVVKHIYFGKIDKSSLRVITKRNELAVIFDVSPTQKNRSAFRSYIRKGLLVISDTYCFSEEKELYAAGLTSDVYGGIKALGSYIKEHIKMPTITVTGSVGKTTTVLLLDAIFGEEYKIFHAGRNRNLPILYIDQMIRRYNKGYNFHIQECGALRNGFLETSARILNPDAFGITKISKTHHTDGYETPEKLIEDKTSFDRVVKEDAFGVINLDDEVLRDYPFKHKIYSYAVENNDADYVARNIIQNGDYLEFDVDDHKNLVHLKVEITGKHNAYNILMAYVFAKQFGLSDEVIKKGLLKYKSEGIRQSVYKIAGRKFYIDCFNVCADSILSSVAALNDMEVPAQGRKIAVLAGENALGEQTFDVNRETGRKLKDYKNIDEFIFVGPREPASLETLNRVGNGKALFEGASETVKDIPMKFMTDLHDASIYIKSITSPGDVVLLKGIFRQPLYAIPDIAFGTNFVEEMHNFAPKIIKTKWFKVYYYYKSDGGDIKRRRSKKPVAYIPTAIQGRDIVRISKGAFAHTLETIILGENQKSVGAEAFKGFPNLKYVQGKSGLCYIGEAAFKNCKNLEVALLENTLHISKEAFKGCSNLKYVELTKACVQIDEDAFTDCPHVRFHAPQGSFAATYAENHGIELCAQEYLKERRQHSMKQLYERIKGYPLRQARRAKRLAKKLLRG